MIRILSTGFRDALSRDDMMALCEEDVDAVEACEVLAVAILAAEDAAGLAEAAIAREVDLKKRFAAVVFCMTEVCYSSLIKDGEGCLRRR